MPIGLKLETRKAESGGGVLEEEQPALSPLARTSGSSGNIGDAFVYAQPMLPVVCSYSREV